jgi:hypothetical protein
MPFPKHQGEHEKGEPEEEALLHMHKTILSRMGDRLRARMPKPEKPADLPMGGAPPDSPAKEHVAKLKAHLARKG